MLLPRILPFRARLHPMGPLAGILCFLGAGLLAAAPTTQYTDYGDPTAEEQYVLEMVNRARANPDAEGSRLGIDIREGLSGADAACLGNPAAARPPLAMNRLLLQTARAHSQDMWTRSFFAHENPDGLDPFERMTAAGYSYSKAGENIATGSSHTVVQLEDLLMRDAGIAGRGHRTNLLDCYAAYYPPPYREVGIGYYSNAAANALGYRNLLTQDFGRRSGTGPFLVGVVYHDANGNGTYDVGEGLSGVQITPNSGAYYAVTASAGGYAIPVGTSGTLDVTASGGGLSSSIVKSVTLAGENIKLDFEAADTGGGGGGGSGGGGHHSSCGSIGLDIMLPLGLLWALRRLFGRRRNR
jgi:hypothetical protein